MQCIKYVHITILLQTARPVLYDAPVVNKMIADVDRIDLNCISSQALNMNSDGDVDIELNAECKNTIIGNETGAYMYAELEIH